MKNSKTIVLPYTQQRMMIQNYRRWFVDPSAKNETEQGGKAGNCRGVYGLHIEKSGCLPHLIGKYYIVCDPCGGDQDLVVIWGGFGLSRGGGGGG